MPDVTVWLARHHLVAMVIPAFAATLFLSAGLMFLVEPMIARMVLPRLGGSPAVWSTCLVFFQAVLLAGYAYAHALTRLLSRSAQILLHVVLLLPLAALALPLNLGTGAPPPGESPALWLLMRLTLVAGPPVFAIAATAPLLQRWFADLDHKAASDPYFLYAGSNAGSLLALIAYPLLVEPTLPLDRQATLWSCGFGALAVGIVLCAAVTMCRGRPTAFGDSGRLPVLVALVVFGYFVPALALLNFSPRRWRFAIGIAAFLLAPMIAGSGDTIATYRSFFGIYRVLTTDDRHARLLMDGTTLHGAESLLPGEEKLPLTYYSHAGPFGRFFAAFGQGSLRHVAVVGLGTGSLACYAQPGQDWTFYEIDPLIERIARDPRYFHFLANCGNHPHVVLGDARLTIASAPDGIYDVLVLDAFSSDSIPIHLLTREALALYLRKLAPGGSLLFHISSRTLDLRPVIAALAADAGLQARMMFDNPPPGMPIWRREPTLVVALAGHGGDLDRLVSADGWADLPPAGTRSLWTDQRSDLLRVIRFGF